MLCLNLEAGAQLQLPGVDPKRPDPVIKEYAELAKRVVGIFDQRAGDIQSIPDRSPQLSESKLVRNIKTRLWLHLLDDIDQLRDPHFNFEDRPTMRVLPPYGKPGVPSSIGSIDPAAISDPAVRREYEEAIRQNNEKAARRYLQLHLKKQDEQYTSQAVQYLSSIYDKTPEDSRELMMYLDLNLNNETHKADMKKKLREFFDAAREPSK